MSEKYWKIWNDAEQAKIDADIEANRKADAVVSLPVADGTEVKIEQLDHDFRFGAHIFNFNQLGKTEYNDAYKASYGAGGIFNQATVAFYWANYEPTPGRLRAHGGYEDTERYWNSLTQEEAMFDANWRRPAPGPVIDFLKSKDVFIHGHILVWGSAKPYWIYDWYCPENEKRNFDALGIPRHSTFLKRARAGAEGNFGFARSWKDAWARAYANHTEREIAALAPVFTERMRRLFRKRVFDVAKDFGEVVDSWDVVNESSVDQSKYDCKSRTGLPVWRSGYGLMPGDYPLHALLDAKEAFPGAAKLAINDFNLTPDFFAQVEDLQQEGARIDLVGMQMHIFNTNDCARLAKGDTNVNWVGTPKIIQDRLDLMAKAGKPIHVSEITITSPGADDRSRMIQAILTRNIYRKWFSHRSLMGITWWNTVDGGGVYGEPLVSGLFTRDMKKKPAYLALDELINREWKTRTTAKAKDGLVRFRGFRGKYRLSYKCADCGAEHVREVYNRGDGLRETPAACKCVSPRPIRNCRVNGRAVTLGAADKALDLAKLTGTKLVWGIEGTVWATVSVKLVAPKAGRYRVCVHNDYYGEYSVNGGRAVRHNGPWQLDELLELDLVAGENVIDYRSRAGSGGGWLFRLSLPSDSELRAL